MSTPIRALDAPGTATPLAARTRTRTALAVAVAWGYLTPALAEPVSRQLDRVIAMLWKLTRP